MKFRHTQTNRGQVAIVVIMIATALMLVGLSLASRVTKETASTTQTKESAVVLSAAESGAEAALSQVINALNAGEELTELEDEFETTTNDGVKVAVNYQITPLNQIQTQLPAGKEVVVDLRDRETGAPAYNGSLVVNWAREATCAERAGLIITTYSLVSGTVESSYQVVGPAGTGCPDRSDHFTQAQNVDLDGYHLQFTVEGLQYDQPSGNGDLFVTFKPVYAQTDLRVVGSPTLTTAQQYTIISRGVNQTTDSGETRAIKIDYSLPLPPNILDYAVLSGSTLAK